MSGECLTDAEIAAYVDGTADARAREKVEAHIADCLRCLHSLAEVKRLAMAHGESPVSTPEAALNRALEIVARKVRPVPAQPAPGISLPAFSVTAALKQGVVRILETTGSLLPPPRLAPVPARKGEKAPPSPRIAKSLCGYRVTLELRAEGDRITAGIMLVDENTSELPEGVKVKLRAGGTSKTRYSREGQVRFVSLDKGNSDFDIEGVGRISLSVQ